MKRVSPRTDCARKSSPVPHSRAQARRRGTYRVRVEELEPRLPPGDMLLGAWFSAGLAEPYHGGLNLWTGLPDEGRSPRESAF